MENTWRLLKKIKIELPCDPAIPLLGVYPKEMKSVCHRDICTSMFIAASVTIAKTWKQPKCPSTDEWIKNRTEYYSVIKKKLFLSFTTHG
jgi:hypothetical protein